MRSLSVFIMSLVVIAMALLSCSKDNATDSPTRPEDQGYAVTLQYQNYYVYMGYYWGCIRLSLDDNHIDRCNLGTNSTSLWTREYNWILYVIDTRQEVETYIQVATGTVQINRNITCVVNGNNITWR